MEQTRDILWYGRGGQGAFSAAKLLGASYALGADGCYALAFPSFGPERRGAPVHAYTKLSRSPVNDRSAIQVPDYALCLDATLLADFNGMQLKEHGFVLTTTPAIEAFAQEMLGRPLVNTALLALLCAHTGLLDEAALERGIAQALPQRIQARNTELVRVAFAQAQALLAGAVLEPSAEQPSQAAEPAPQVAGGFVEFMDLTSADAFLKPQQVYRPASEEGGVQ